MPPTSPPGRPAARPAAGTLRLAVLLTALLVAVLAAAGTAGGARPGRPAARWQLVAATPSSSPFAATPVRTPRPGPARTIGSGGGGGTASPAASGSPAAGGAAARPASPTAGSPLTGAGSPAGVRSSGAGSSWAGVGGCSVFDPAGCLTVAVTGWLAGMVTSSTGPLLGLLGRTVLSTPNVTGTAVRRIWTVSVGIVDSLMVLLIIAGGVLVMTRDSAGSRYTVKDVASRLVIAALAVNTSLLIVATVTRLANALAAALLGAAPAGGLAGTLTGRLAGFAGPALTGGGMLLVALGLVVSVLLVALLITFLGRLAVLVLLAALAPLLLIWHALPATDRLARLWWRALAGCAGVQIAQAGLLLIALRVFTAGGPGRVLGLPAASPASPAGGPGGGGGLLAVLVVLCLLYLAVRLPGHAVRLVTGRPATSLIRAARYYLPAAGPGRPPHGGASRRPPPPAGRPTRGGEW